MEVLFLVLLAVDGQQQQQPQLDPYDRQLQLDNQRYSSGQNYDGQNSGQQQSFNGQQQQFNGQQQSFNGQEQQFNGQQQQQFNNQPPYNGQQQQQQQQQIERPNRCGVATSVTEPSVEMQIRIRTPFEIEDINLTLKEFWIRIRIIGKIQIQFCI